MFGFPPIKIRELASMFSAALMMPSPPSLAADNTVQVNVSGGVVHKIHGVENISPQLFGLDRGSGGISGWQEMNCQWFRNTSVVPMPDIREDPAVTRKPSVSSPPPSAGARSKS